MSDNNAFYSIDKVSLFTREWIEIAAEYTALQEQLSPSLRGSGLKFPANPLVLLQPRSPSLRGSGLKLVLSILSLLCSWSPSLRGSGLKLLVIFIRWMTDYVSLFTREWIEIVPPPVLPVVGACLPLYEGVD